MRQIRLNRTLSNLRGSFLYSAKFLARPELQTALAEVYPSRSLWPENPRIEAIVPAAPSHPALVHEGANVRLTWQGGANNRRFVVYRIPEGVRPDFDDPAYIVCVTGNCEAVLPRAEGRYFVSALSPTHHESEAVSF